MRETISYSEGLIIDLLAYIFLMNMIVLDRFFTATPVKECKEIEDLITGRSWKAGGPITLEEITYLKVAYIDFDGNFRTDGELNVHKEEAQKVLAIFWELLLIGFPIASIRLVDRYFQAGEEKSLEDISAKIDNLSMHENNTSALFVRRKTDDDVTFSNHSTGRAIDINPKNNPMIKYQDKEYKIPIPGKIYPPSGLAYQDRTDKRKGMVNDKVVAIFAKHGFPFWGGNWTYHDHVRDYQHFSSVDRYALGGGLPTKS